MIRPCTIALLAALLSGCNGLSVHSSDDRSAQATIDPAPHGSDGSASSWRLVSVKHNMSVDDFLLRGASVTPDAPPWHVQQRTLHGGRQEGSKLVEIDNGVLKIVVVPTRGMSVLRVDGRRTRVGWDSSVKEVVNPAYVNLTMRNHLGWLEGFNEWLVRCGLESFGAPGPDDFHLAPGEAPAFHLPLHGKIGNIPASEVELIVDKKPPHRITLRGVVYEQSHYGPNFKLLTELSTTPGASSFTIKDTVTNQSGQTQEFQLLYHPNFGPPLLGAGAKLVAPLKRVQPRDARAAEGDLKQFATYGPPKTNYPEQVYLLELWGDEQGETAAMLQSPAGDRGLLIGHSLKQLPYFTVWKSEQTLADGYVTGIEPGTGYPFPRPIERHFGRVPQLKAGQSRSFQLEFTVLEDKAAVDAAATKIQAFQARRPTQFVEEPVKLPEE